LKTLNSLNNSNLSKSSPKIEVNAVMVRAQAADVAHLEAARAVKAGLVAALDADPVLALVDRVADLVRRHLVRAARVPNIRLVMTGPKGGKVSLVKAVKVIRAVKAVAKAAVMNGRSVMVIRHWLRKIKTRPRIRLRMGIKIQTAIQTQLTGKPPMAVLLRAPISIVTAA
jgi:hypothetical protein